MKDKDETSRIAIQYRRSISYKNFCFQIERSLLKHLGAGELEDFHDFLLEKEQLISCSAELSDKIKLCKKQIMELELGHPILDM